MADVEILGIPQSTYVRAVRIACEEKGVSYELKPFRPHSPEISAIHPFGKIPAMRHGDFEVCESKAIATYLDLTFSGPRLIPTTAREAALTEKWISLVNTQMDSTLVRTYLFAYIFPKTDDGSPNRQVIETVKPAMDEQLAILDRGLSRSDYLAGSAFTFADMNLMPILFWLQKFPEGAAGLAANRNLGAYYERVSARPSLRNTVPPPPPPSQTKPN